MRKVDSKSLDLHEVLLDVARVSKVTKGGRQFSFRVIMLLGNHKGCVGYGMAKHTEVLEAKNKAIKKAKKSMVRVSLKEGRTIYHECFSKFCASKIFLKPAVAGTGIVGGGAIKQFCEVLGITDIITKSYGTSTPHVVIQNIMKALSSIYPPRYIINKRDKKPGSLLAS